MVSADTNPRFRQQGVALLALLVAVAIMGTLFAATGEVWRTVAQRDKELELLFAGQQIRRAIMSYRDSSPPGAREYPRSLADLLEDKRFPYPVRHLRKIYRDPMTNSERWGYLMMGDRIIGVHSLSELSPMKQSDFPLSLEMFNGSTSYRQWVFVAN